MCMNCEMYTYCIAIEMNNSCIHIDINIVGMHIDIVNVSPNEYIVYQDIYVVYGYKMHTKDTYIKMYTYYSYVKTHI